MRGVLIMGLLAALIASVPALCGEETDEFVRPGNSERYKPPASSPVDQPANLTGTANHGGHEPAIKPAPSARIRHNGRPSTVIRPAKRVVHRETLSKQELERLLRTAEFQKLPEKYRAEIRQALHQGLVFTTQPGATADSQEFAELSPLWQQTLLVLRAKRQALQGAEAKVAKHRQWDEAEHGELRQQLADLRQQIEDNPLAILALVGLVLGIVAIVVLFGEE